MWKFWPNLATERKNQNKMSKINYIAAYQAFLYLINFVSYHTHCPQWGGCSIIQ